MGGGAVSIATYSSQLIQEMLIPFLAQYGFFLCQVILDTRSSKTPSCLLTLVTRYLKGKHFQEIGDARDFFEGMISDMPQSTWSDASVM